MKKVLTILLLSVFMFSLVSAFEFDNVQDTVTITFDGKIVKDNPLLEIYSPIKISNAFDLPLIGDTLFEGYLSSHTETCGDDCSSTIEVKIGNNDVLIQDVIFKTLQSNGKWVEQDVRSYQFNYWGSIDDYSEVCSGTIELSNKTIIDDCKNVLSGSHEGWINYNIGDKLNAGIYTIKLNAQKKNSRTVDWIIKTNGIWLNDWATWGNITLGDDAEVILNTPIDNYILLSNPQKFNATATITGGATVVNMSLFTNETGTWGLRNTSTGAIDYNGQVITTGGDSTDLQTGVMILTKSSGTLTRVTVATGVTGTNAILTTGADVQIANATITGGVATFNTVLADNTYYNIYIDKAGASYIRYYKPGTTFPIIGTNINWIAGRKRGGANETTVLYNIQSVTFGTSEELIINRTITEGIIWNAQVCDSDGDCGFASSNYTLLVDETSPTISLENPTGTVNYGVVGYEILNVTFTDTNLDSCWYDYNGTNITIEGCVSGVKNSTTFISSVGDTNITIWSNDSVGNTNMEYASWDYKILENNRTHNTSTYETDYETYSINVTANSSLTAVKLLFNNTAYSMSNSGSGIWTYSRDLPTTSFGNNSIGFNFTYASSTIPSTYTTYQYVNNIVFTLCNSTYSTQFLNISFKDESDLTPLTAAIQASTWTYYLGTGTQTKSYLFSNTTDNANYTFCAYPDRTIYVVPIVTYLNTSYPARNYQPGVQTYTNSITNEVLYLLNADNGIYTTFVTVDSLNTILSGTSILITRNIGGGDITVAQGTTDSSGGVTFWLNPLYPHTIYASKTGYGSSTQIVTPTQATYTLTLQSASNYSYVSNTRGLLWGIFPRIGLTNATSQNFGFNVSSVYGNLVKCKVELLNKDKSITLSSNEYVTANSSICSVSTTYTINNTYPQIKGRLLVDIGDGYQILEEDAYWVILEVDSTGMTIKDWLGNLKSFDLKYFAGGSDEVKQQHREYTQILLFFLIVTIICATLNMTGWDIQTNGGMIFLIGFFVWIASFAGFLNLAYISPFLFIDKYFVALIYSMFMIGFATRSFS